MPGINRIKRIKEAVVPFLILAMSFSGCISYRPNITDRSSFMQRAQTQEKDNLRATITVLSDKESKKTFGVNLAKKGIQPVWLEIENQGITPYVFIPHNMDPNYYSTEEASYMAHFKKSRQLLEAGLIAIIFFPALAIIPVNLIAANYNNKKMDTFFNKVALPSNIIMPKSKESGFVFTSVDEGTKHVKVELLGNEGPKTMDFVVTVPGIKPDYTTKDYEDRYPEETVTECSTAQIPELLKKIPCCTTNKKGTKNGDPFNLVVLGELEDVITIFTSAGWDETKALTAGSGFAMAKAFFTGESDRYSPVSPLYYKGHPQDIALQKARNTINQRLHLRLWYTPIRCNGKPVWIGTISRDIGVRLTTKTWYLTTHKIDPNLDDARDYLLADLMQVFKVTKFGFIKNQALEQSTHPRKNLTGDPYQTDNKLLVLELSTQDVPVSSFSWNDLVDHLS
ncbi:MAG TPA: LssY C-terminal domain-containing protein [Candidatus Omnitrophota bacterium]|nr:LssY C-terminal domain-containing protein [Candidatus Omnitrophota bacterium]